MLFNEEPFLDRFAVAAEMGFDGVELLFPYSFDKRELRGLLIRHKLQLVLHDMPAGDWDSGERGIACLPDRKCEFEASVELAIEYARALNCPRLNCLAGIAPANADPHLIRKTLVQNLRLAAQKAAVAGLEVLLEPINSVDMPGYYVTRSQQALNIIADAEAKNLKLQYDVYHMQIMEANLTGTIRDHLDKIGHIQIADHPGRHEPGTGKIDFSSIFQCLDQCRYTGWVGCEYQPKIDTKRSLQWLAATASRTRPDC